MASLSVPDDNAVLRTLPHELGVAVELCLGEIRAAWAQMPPVANERMRTALRKDLSQLTDVGRLQFGAELASLLDARLSASVVLANACRPPRRL